MFLVANANLERYYLQIWKGKVWLLMLLLVFKIVIFILLYDKLSTRTSKTKSAYQSPDGSERVQQIGDSYKKFYKNVKSVS